MEVCPLLSTDIDAGLVQQQPHRKAENIACVGLVSVEKNISAVPNEVIKTFDFCTARKYRREGERETRLTHEKNTSKKTTKERRNKTICSEVLLFRPEKKHTKGTETIRKVLRNKGR